MNTRSTSISSSVTWIVADGVEGVEVHGAEPAGPGEVWLRGLLRDQDVYLLLAWNRRGGLFDDPEMADFFASFRLEAR